MMLYGRYAKYTGWWFKSENNFALQRCPYNFLEVLLIEVAVSLRYYFLLNELFKYKGFNRRPMPNNGLTCRDFFHFTMLQLSNLC